MGELIWLAVITLVLYFSYELVSWWRYQPRLQRLIRIQHELEAKGEKTMLVMGRFRPRLWRGISFEEWRKMNPELAPFVTIEPLANRGELATIGYVMNWGKYMAHHDEFGSVR